MTIIPHETDLCALKKQTDVDQSPEQQLAALWQKVFDDAEDLGWSDIVADLYREDSLEAEHRFQEMVFGFSRATLKRSFETLGDQGPTLSVEGQSSHKVDITVGDAMTLFEPVEFKRSRDRPSGKGASMIPAESILGLTTGGMTPAAAGVSMYLMSSLTVRESEEAWRTFCGQEPSTSSLLRLPDHASWHQTEGAMGPFDETPPAPTGGHLFKTWWIDLPLPIVHAWAHYSFLFRAEKRKEMSGVSSGRLSAKHRPPP